VTLALVAGYFLWTWLFPSPELVIRKRLSEVARLASFGSNEAPLAKMANSGKLLNYFAPEVEVVIDVAGRPQYSVTGIEDFRNAVMGARATLNSLKVELLDISVHLDPTKRSASVVLAAKAQVGGESDLFVERMRFQMQKGERGWLISRLETVPTLQ
jgi:hypothetical protein